MKNPVIGQEAICPDGLGRVVKFDFKPPYKEITVATYIDNRQCNWAVENITLIPINATPNVPVIDLDALAWCNIKQAAKDSKWMVDDYCMDNWVSDVINFLIDGSLPGES